MSESCRPPRHSEIRPQEGAERREAHLTMSALTRGCALLPKRRARLSALTLAALATGYHPDGSAPEPGFLKARRQGVLPVRRRGLELSTLRADRSFCRSTGDPEPPGSGSHSSARGHRPLLRPSKVPSRKATLSEQGDLR